MDDVTLRLSVADFNKVVRAVGKQPWEDVVLVMAYFAQIAQQSQAAVQAAGAADESAPPAKVRRPRAKRRANGAADGAPAVQ